MKELSAIFGGILLLMTSAGAFAINKCVSPSGRVSYQTSPCSASSKTEIIQSGKANNSDAGDSDKTSKWQRFPAWLNEYPKKMFIASTKMPNVQYYAAVGSITMASNGAILSVDDRTAPKQIWISRGIGKPGFLNPTLCMRSQRRLDAKERKNALAGITLLPPGQIKTRVADIIMAKKEVLVTICRARLPVFADAGTSVTVPNKTTCPVLDQSGKKAVSAAHIGFFKGRRFKIFSIPLPDAC